jgi:7-carboxy-7-deazaguanine synthase (Cx14CxxC type)
MSYAVKEIFLTLQGEGFHAGRAAVFCRFTGCNLWSGREQDRATATCSFCDTDFVGADAGRFATPEELAQAIKALWPVKASGTPFVVFTGGEPLLQLDEALLTAMHAHGFEIAVETNGTIAPAPPGIDWLCVSPKAGSEWLLRQGDELKLVLPQPGFDLEALSHLPFQRFSLQAMDGPRLADNLAAAVALCLAHPAWRLSVQTHKALGIR